VFRYHRNNSSLNYMTPLGNQNNTYLKETLHTHTCHKDPSIKIHRITHVMRHTFAKRVSF